MNNKIFAKSVQVITADGKNLGVMPTAQALQIASDEGEEHMLKWHNARTTELQNVYKACVQLKATLSEYATRTLGYRNTQIFDDVIKYSRYKFDEFKDELHFINKLQTL